MEMVTEEELNTMKPATLVVHVQGHEYSLPVAPREGVFGRVWESSVVLASLVLHTLSAMTPKVRIIEIGAGSALPSIVAASAGADVTITDLEQALPISRLSVRLNCKYAECRVKVARLDWTDTETDILPLRAPFDIVLGT